MPFKTVAVRLPNNLAVAKERIQGLKRRFKFNQHFHQEYVKYMNIIIACNYAERVPKDQLHCDNERVWYVPHHGVNHQRKRALRVVLFVEKSQ